MQIFNGHIAIVVSSLTHSLNRIRALGFKIGEVEIFPNEGTKEVYVGVDNTLGTLLVIQPISEGPYMRALKKRGQGLHHICLTVENLIEYISNLSGSGWLLHPSSIKTIKQNNTAWLARPGVPTLLEIYQPESITKKTKHNAFISVVEIPEPSERKGLLASLRAPHIRRSADQRSWFTIADTRYSIDDFIVLS